VPEFSGHPIARGKLMVSLVVVDQRGNQVSRQRQRRQNARILLQPDEVFRSRFGEPVVGPQNLFNLHRVESKIILRTILELLHGN